MSGLKKFKLSIEDINAHVGWAYNSSEFKRYFRFVSVSEIDKKFFAALL